jgi:hypothetical protein
VLVLINGAIKSATELFNTIVFPMLDKGGVPFVAEKTARRGRQYYPRHAMAFVGWCRCIF